MLTKCVCLLYSGSSRQWRYVCAVCQHRTACPFPRWWHNSQTWTDIHFINGSPGNNWWTGKQFFPLNGAADINKSVLFGFHLNESQPGIKWQMVKCQVKPEWESVSEMLKKRLMRGKKCERVKSRNRRKTILVARKRLDGRCCVKHTFTMCENDVKELQSQCFFYCTAFKDTSVKRYSAVTCAHQYWCFWAVDRRDCILRWAQVLQYDHLNRCYENGTYNCFPCDKCMVQYF